MIVSALLTSVGINLGLCVLFFALYSILRKQPGNVKFYVPRLVAEGRARQRSEFNIESLLPSPGWVRKALEPSEEDLLASCGLDAVVFMRIFIFSLRVFSVAAVVGICILLPVNYLGDQLRDIDFTDLPNKSLDLFSISNVKDGSNRAVSTPGKHVWLQYHTFCKTDAENLYRRLAHLKSRPVTSQNNHRGSFLGLFGKNVDLAGHYAKQLEDLEENVRIKQSDIYMAGEEVPAAFICFKSRYGAATALHIRQSIKPTEWVTEEAPEPHDVYWPFFSTSFMQRWMSKVVVLVASVLLIVVFLLIVAFVQGLTYLDQLEIWFPFLKKILTITVVSQVITGYLPSLILHLLSSYVPSIMKLFSTMQGYIAHITSQLQIILDPKNIPSRLAVVVPAQASLYVSFIF
ncbi:putative CSC1-like protein [Cocos nucifera]|uniref:Putative CSC1-like protein n=1 Tax=Cocos nucifera TaxID=13894 RepID=A0A8K0ID66_COCNU|nr:putative CSC1-like protein [Cocos nucifera]